MKYLLLVLLLPFFVSACATSPHAPESRPLNFQDGSSQVKVKFDKEDEAAVGSEVTALDKQCRQVPWKDYVRTKCITSLVGIGNIVGINGDISTVEFKSEPIVAETEYEVLKNGGGK